MPAVAEVQFKAAGSQQVVSAFNSVGTAAQTSSTKVQQNSTAMSSLGKGMKSSVAGIGQVTTAFATLSLSIVNTYRSYRDLGDAQLQVDRANLKVSKTQNAIRLLEKDIAKDRKAGAKGSLDYAIASNKIVQAEQKLAKDRKDGKHTAAELKGEELAIAKMRKTGVGNTQQLSDKETKLQLLREQLGVATTNAGEAQERFNDIQQNFYLSIAPLAISTIGTLTTAFSGLKGMLTGGGGLIGGLGPIGLILGGITLAIIAFKTNFLGLRDAVGGVIRWLQDRFGAWKDTIQQVFGFIQKGDWGGAFNKIREAAVAFWQDLKTQVPLLTAVETVVNAIKNGNWKYAFSTIVAAAELMWFELKKKVPFFGTIETVINQIKGGKWEEAFKTIGDSIMKGLQSILGLDLTEKIVLKFQLMKDSAYAELNLMKDAFTKKGGPIDLINQGLAKLGSGDVVGGFTGIWIGFDKAIGILNTRFNDWVKLNFGVDLGALETQAKAIGTKILTGIQSSLTFIAKTWIDPLVAQLFLPSNWMAAITAVASNIQTVGMTIFNFLAGAINVAATDPKATTDWWTGVGQAIWDGITGWMTTNLPDTAKAMESLWTSITESVNSATVTFQNWGIDMWNGIIDGMKAGIKGTHENPIFGLLIPDWFGAVSKAMNDPKWKELGHVARITPELDTSKLVAGGKAAAKTIGNIKSQITVSSVTTEALQKAKQAQAKIDDMRATINVSSHFTGFGHGAGFGFQHGYQGTIKRPTMFIAGEGGRPEDVTVRPRGSAQRGGSGGGGGGFYGTVNVYVDGVLRTARYSMGARK